MIDFVVAGLSANSVPYIEALELQRAVHRSVVAGSRPDTVILLEHPSVYTAGKRTEPSERPTDGTPVIDVVGYVRRLEGILIETLALVGVVGERVEGRSGVWVGNDKIAAIGIRVAEGATMHGFAINCDNGFDAYERIVACGIRDSGVTSISRVLGHTVTTGQVAPLVERAFTRAMADA